MNLVYTSKDIENYGVQQQAEESADQFSAKISKMNIMNENTVKAHVVYTVSTQFPDGKSAVVNRRYNDFEWLQKSLESKHKDILIPPIPEKDALSRFHASVLQYRKREFNRFLARLTLHPILKDDSNVNLFLTAADDALQEQIKADSLVQQVGNKITGVSFASVVASVTNLGQQLTTEVDEVDPWYSTQSEYLEGLDRGLTLTKKNSSHILSIKSDQVASELLVAEYLRHLADLENEHDKKMSKYLTTYQDFLAQKTVLDETLVKNQTAMFEDAVTDQQRLSVASSRILSNRLDVLHQFQIAQLNLSNKVNANPSTEKLALEKQEAEEKEAEEKKKFEDITGKVKEQVEDYKSEKSKLMRWALRELVRENIEYGEQVISQWKDLGNILATMK